MSELRKLLDIVTESDAASTSAANVSSVSQPMTTQRRVQEQTPAAPQVIEYGNWENSALTTSSKLKKSRDRTAKVVKSIYGESTTKKNTPSRVKKTTVAEATGDTGFDSMMNKISATAPQAARSNDMANRIVMNARRLVNSDDFLSIAEQHAAKLQNLGTADIGTMTLHTLAALADLAKSKNPAIRESQLEEQDLIVNPAAMAKNIAGLVGKKGPDHEVAMAKTDLFQSGKNAAAIFSMIKNRSEQQGLEGWVQAKLTKAADYLKTVRDYLEGAQLESMDGVSASTRMFANEQQGAPELLKAEMPLVRHIEQELAKHGYEKGTEEYDTMFKHQMAMYRKFGNVDAIKQGVTESDSNTQSHAEAFKSETDTMKPGTKKYVGRKGGKEVHAKKDAQGNVKFYHRDGIKGQLKAVREGVPEGFPYDVDHMPGRLGSRTVSGQLGHKKDNVYATHRTLEKAQAVADKHGFTVKKNSYVDPYDKKTKFEYQVIKGVAEAIPYALSAANANAEFERTKTFVPRGYKGRVDTDVRDQEEYRAVMATLNNLAQAQGQHVECGLSGNAMSIFSKTMDSDALDEFIDTALEDFDQGVAEGSDIKLPSPAVLADIMKNMTQDQKIAFWEKLQSQKKEKPEGVAEGSDYQEPKLGTIKANLMNTTTPTVQVQVFKHNTLRGDNYWVTKEVRKFKTMDLAKAYIDRINKQGVAEGSGPKEKQKTPYRDINSPVSRAAAEKQKQQMAKDKSAEPGKNLADKIAKKGVAEGFPDKAVLEKAVGLYREISKKYPHKVAVKKAAESYNLDFAKLNNYIDHGRYSSKQGVAEGSLTEFAPGDGGDEYNDRSRRLQKLLEIAIKVARENNVGTLSMVHAMNIIASDDFFSIAVEGLLPDISNKELVFVIQSAYKKALAELPKSSLGSDPNQH